MNNRSLAEQEGRGKGRAHRTTDCIALARSVKRRGRPTRAFGALLAARHRRGGLPGGAERRAGRRGEGVGSTGRERTTTCVSARRGPTTNASAGRGYLIST